MRILFYLILVLLVGSCRQPEIKVSQLEALKDSIIKQLAHRSADYYFSDDLLSLGNLLDSLQPTVEQLNDARVTLNWAMPKTQIMNLQGKKDSTQFYMRLLSDKSQSKDMTKKDLLNFYISFGSLLRKESLLDSAIKMGNSAYHLAIQLDSFRYAETCFDLSGLYGMADDQDNAMKYLFEAWRCRDKEPDLTPALASSMASYYDKTKQWDSALYFLNKFYEDSTYLGSSDMKTWSLDNTAYFLTKQNKFKEAAAYQLRGMALTRKAGGLDIFQYNNMAEIYGLMGEYDKAIVYIDSAHDIAVEKKNYSIIKEAWKVKADLLAKQKKFSGAYSALDSAFAVYESEMDSSFRDRARELETQYSVREKDAAIKLLATENKSSQRLRQQQGLIIVTLIVAALLASFIGVMLFRRRQLKVNAREADLRQQLLRTQMEPHFLFNMLALLQALIETDNRDKSVSFLTKFSRLLRLILENARESFVILDNELAVLESYLSLQAMYHEGKFDYDIDVDSSIQKDHVQIPPMLLQPFVENAIQHGFQHTSHQGKLSIQIVKLPNALYCRIEDNGGGIQASKETITKRIHAIDITLERLKILGKQTKMPAKLTVVDKKSRNEGDGVRVEMEIPYLPA